MPALDAVLHERGNQLRKDHLWRSPLVSEAVAGTARRLIAGTSYLSFAENDYLGLSTHPKLVDAAREAAERYGSGGAASKLVTGHSPLLEELEHKLAAFKQTEAACVFGSGYLANIGTIPALVNKGDLIIADRWVHACLLDGCRLSGAKTLRFVHNDMEHLERLLTAQRSAHRHALVVVDGVYSMDGDRAPLDRIANLCKQHDAWLMVDDAHGLGVLGRGRGTAHEWSPLPEIQIQMGTLSKSIGAYGGYVAGSKALIELLHNRARSLVFSTALPPAVIGAALGGLQMIEQDSAQVEKPLKLAKQFTELLKLPMAQSAIVPVILGTSEKALEAAEALRSEQIWVPAIRPPTVPAGTARLRVSFTANHTSEDVERLAFIIDKKGWLTCSSY